MSAGINPAPQLDCWGASGVAPEHNPHDRLGCSSATTTAQNADDSNVETPGAVSDAVLYPTAPENPRLGPAGQRLSAVIWQPPKPEVDEPEALDSSAANCRPHVAPHAPHSNWAVFDDPSQPDTLGPDRLSKDSVLESVKGFTLFLTQRPGQWFQLRIQALQRMMVKGGESYIFRTCNPVEALFSSRKFQLVLLTLAVLWIYRGVNALYVAADVANVGYRFFNFSVLELRNGTKAHSSQLLQTGIDGFGVYGGRECNQRKIPGAQWQVGGSFVVEYDRAETFDGFYFTTSTNGDPSDDPVRWEVFASEDGREWLLIGASFNRIEDNGRISALGQHAYKTPEERGMPVYLNLRPLNDWLWISGWVLANCEQSLCSLVSSFLAFRGNERAAVLCWYSVCALLAIQHSIVALGYEVKSASRVAFWYWALSIWYTLWPCLLTLYERSFILILYGLGCYIVIAEWIMDFVAYSDPVSFSSNPSVAGIACILLAFILSSYKWFLRYSVAQLVSEDIRRYQAVFASILADREQAKALDTLAKLVREIHTTRNQFLSFTNGSTVGREHLPDRPRHHYFPATSVGRREDTEHSSVGNEHQNEFSAVGSSASSVIEIHTENGEIEFESAPSASQDFRRLRGSSSASNMTTDVPWSRQSSTYSVTSQARRASEARRGSEATLMPYLGNSSDSPYNSAGWGQTDRPVRLMSLDQLFSQAICLEPILRNKVQQWAAKSSGLFPDPRNPGDFVRWSDCVENPDLADSIDWKGIKHVDRAIEKLLTVYGNDCSLLTDVCRSRLTFENAHDLLKAVRVLREDLDVVVLKAKNNYQQLLDAQSSAGFRFVKLLLTIDTPESRFFGVEAHVCEVLFILKPFVQAMEQCSHSRYLTFRNFDRAGGYRSKFCPNLSPFAERVMPLWSEALWRRLSCTGRFDSRGPKKMNTASPQPGLETTLLMRNTEPPGFLQERVSTGHRLNSVDANSVFFTAKPIAAVLSRWKWRVFICILATASLFRCINAITVFVQSRTQVPSFDTYRFTVFETRNQHRPATLSVSSIGLLMDSCEISGVDTAITTTNESMYLHLSYPTKVNGFTVVTSLDNPEYDPVKFRLEAQKEDGRWTTVGSSIFRFMDDGSIRFLDRRFDTPFKRGHRVKFDLRLKIPWLLSFLSSLPLTIAYFFLVIRSTFERFENVNMVLCGGMYFSGALAGISGIVMWYSGCHEDGGFWILFACGLVVMAISISVKESYLIAVFGIFGAYTCMIEYLRNTVFHQDAGSFAHNVPITGLIFFTIGAVASCLRAYIVRRASGLVKADERAYDALWSRILQQNEDALGRLVTKVQEIPVGGFEHPRQLHQADSTHEDSLHHVTAGSVLEAVLGQNSMHDLLLLQGGSKAWTSCNHALTTGAMRLPVKDLDQIYCQAITLEPVLRAKVQKWAKRCDGLFPAKNGRRMKYISWKEVEHDARLASHIKWRGIKTVQRSVEKILRVYGGDASFLCDCVRHAIIIEDVADMIRCVSELNQDEDVKVLRAKNRMDPRVSAKSSAGFRNISFNIQISNTETKKMGLDCHVCEVQLILKAMAENMHCEGHKRYVKFRNYRGE